MVTKYKIVKTNWMYDTLNPVEGCVSLQDALKKAVKYAPYFKGISITKPIPDDKYGRNKQIGVVVAVRTGMETPLRYVYLPDDGPIRELTKSGSAKRK